MSFLSDPTCGKIYCRKRKILTKYNLFYCTKSSESCQDVGVFPFPCDVTLILEVVEEVRREKLTHFHYMRINKLFTTLFGVIILEKKDSLYSLNFPSL